MSKGKKCFKCGEVKCLSEFYSHPRMGDGHLNKCKECNKKDVTKNRRRRAEYYKQYDRDRANLSHRVKARKEYAKTEQGKRAMNRGRLRYAKKNPHKKKVSQKLNNGIRDGKIQKPSSCFVCKKDNCRIEGHHEDYSKPFDVMWLCRKCHAQIHKDR